jgi:hypothetical protein
VLAEMNQRWAMAERRHASGCVQQLSA